VVNLEASNLNLKSLHLYPTFIKGLQVNRTKSGPNYDWIKDWITACCQKFGTKVVENKDEGKLEIIL